ncbi:BglG family transcription antiterminator [Enterococcus faecalis]|nr:hypothetical protein [Enterococcus faecalis]MEB8146411.1 hypothetical protein [Enterococcus faecalis]
MIESYIEKDIMRQIKVVEYLFELKRVVIKEIADFLKVSKVTIKRDIERILIIEPNIKVIDKSSSIIEVQFWPNATRYELVKKIYAQSNFLHVCSFYLLEETNYLKIVEKEHISVAKAFNLRNKVEDFFMAVGIMDVNKKFLDDELKMRLIFLTVWMRIDLIEEKINKKNIYEAKNIVKQFINEFSNAMNNREILFFERVIYLAIERQKMHMNIPDKYKLFVKQGILYNKEKTILEKYKFNENEIIYISMMYRLLNQNLSTYHYLIIEYEQIRKAYIDDISDLIELVHEFERAFNRDLLKDIMFEKAFLRFIISSFINQQMFLVEKHYFLSKEQQELCVSIEDVLNEWNKKKNYGLQLSKRTTEKFCIQVSELLINDASKRWNVFIVAEDEFSHVAYREWIERRLNTDRIIIDNTLYYSLNSLPVYIDIETSVILCERSLLNAPDEVIKQSKTFPISLVSINDDLRKFFSYIFN